MPAQWRAALMMSVVAMVTGTASAAEEDSLVHGGEPGSVGEAEHGGGSEHAGEAGANAILFLFTAVVCGLLFRCAVRVTPLLQKPIHVTYLDNAAKRRHRPTRADVP